MGIFGPDTSASDTPRFSSDLSDSTPSNNNVFERELEDFLLQEKQKAHIHAQVLEFNDVCWEKCFTELVGNKLSKKTEACLSNCVDRFVDASIFIINRFAGNIQKNST